MARHLQNTSECHFMHSHYPLRVKKLSTIIRVFSKQKKTGLKFNYSKVVVLFINNY